MGDVIASKQTGEYYLDYDTPKYPNRVYVGDRYYTESGYSSITNKNLKSCTISNFLNLDSIYNQSDIKEKNILKKNRVYSINNSSGYVRLPKCYFSNIDVLTYNNENDEPLRIIKCAYLDSFRLFPNETRIRLQFHNDDKFVELWDSNKSYIKDSKITKDESGIGYKCIVSNSTEGEWIEDEWEVLEGRYVYKAESEIHITELIHSGCIIENCYIHDCHRGGIASSPSDTEIRNCIFRKTYDENNATGIPEFYNPTRYHIDYEDSYVKNITISNCLFSSDSNDADKVLMGCYNFNFNNNNMTNGQITVFNCFNVNIYNNYLRKDLIVYGWVGSDQENYINGLSYLKRNINFYNNICTELMNAAYGAYDIDDGTLLFVHNNKFIIDKQTLVGFGRKNNNIILKDNVFNIQTQTNLLVRSYLPLLSGNNIFDSKNYLDNRNGSYFVFNHKPLSKDYTHVINIPVRVGGLQTSYMEHVKTTNSPLGIYMDQDVEEDTIYCYVNDVIINSSVGIYISISNVIKLNPKNVYIKISNSVFNISSNILFASISPISESENILSFNLEIENCDFTGSTSKSLIYKETASSQVKIKFNNCKFNNDIKYEVSDKKPFRLKSGPFENRPDDPDINYEYLCTSINGLTDDIYIYYKGHGVWMDLHGNIVDDNYPATPPATSGTTEERPLGVDPGFQYFDTTLKKPIWKTEDGWVDCTGASV